MGHFVPLQHVSTNRKNSPSTHKPQKRTQEQTRPTRGDRKTLVTMMALIDEDIAKYIWGFFLEFDDDDDDANSSTAMDTHLDRRVDFESIRSLRCVNKLFYNAFQEVSGWSRCALAIKCEYQNLKNDEKFFDNWSVTFRLQTLRGNRFSPAQEPLRNHSYEERRQVGKFVSRAMERKKVSVYRCNQLIRMLDRGPFTEAEKQLLSKQLLLVVQ